MNISQDKRGNAPSRAEGANILRKGAAGKEGRVTDEKSYTERRAHPRYPLLTTGEAKHVALQGAGEFRVAATNISMGGMVVHADSGGIVEPGDILTLKFSILQEPPVELHARVVWKRKGIESVLGEWSFGLLYFNTSEDEIRRLHDPARAAFRSDLAPETFKD
jgi:hypothetical protein